LPATAKPSWFDQKRPGAVGEAHFPNGAARGVTQHA
jgi:hypothetical protein